MDDRGITGPTLQESVHEMIDIDLKISKLEAELATVKSVKRALVHDLVADLNIPETSVIYHNGKTYLLDADLEEAKYINVTLVENLGT